MNSRLLFVIVAATLMQCVPIRIEAQSLRWSPAMQDYTRVPFLRIIGSAGDNVYVLRSNFSFESSGERIRSKNRKLLLQCFNNIMDLRWEHEIEFPSEDMRFADISMLNERMVILGFTMNRDKNTYEFFARFLDQNGSFSGDPVPLDTLSASEQDDEKKPKLILSHSQELLAFGYRKERADEAGQSFRVTVLDTSLTRLYTHEISLPANKKQFVPSSIVLTDRGNFYILGMKFLTEKKVKAPGESYYLMMGYNPSSEKESADEIKLEDKFLTDVALSVDDRNNQILVAGFYSDRNTYSTAGVFYYAWREDSMKAGQVAVTPFSQNYLMKFIGEQKDLKSRELLNYSIDRLVLRQDGGAVIVAESYYQTSRSYWDYYMQTMMTHYYYHFGNIMVLSINPDGSVLWNNVISKDQNSVDDIGYYSSYISAISNGILYAAYNRYADEESPVMLTAIDGQGRQETKTLYRDNEGVLILSRIARQIDEQTLIIPAYKQNKFCFLTMQF
ncbi:MAG: hypothetical protein IT242_07940 [Bacteroidia bacterium]|nr:hypothetical protein [Bacteroidia bacterium]